MPRCLAFALAFSLAPCALAQDPSPAPSPAGYTAADFKALTAARVERVLDAVPKMQAWARALEKEGKAVGALVDAKGAAAVPQAMAFAQDAASAQRFAKDVGMPMEEFWRDWGLVMTAYSAAATDDALRAGREEMEKTLKDPNTPEEGKAAVREALAQMEKSRTLPEVPPETRTLLGKHRARIEALSNSGASPEPEGSPAPEPAPEPAEQ